MNQKSDRPLVFLTFANAAGQAYLNQLKKESGLLRDLFLPLHQKGEIELLREESLDNTELPKLLNQYKGRISIFHYGGHANGNRLSLEDGEGNVKGLAELLRLQSGLNLVFLNGCSTQGQAQPYLEAGVPVVLATSASIADEEATFFAEHFYHALINRHTIREAFQSASGALKTRSSNYQIGGEEIITYRRIAPEEDAFRETPWRLYVQEGKEAALDWRFSESLTQGGNSAEAAGIASGENKGKRPIWHFITGVGVIIGILAGLGRITGYNIQDLFGAKKAIASNTVMIKVNSQNDIALPAKGKVYLTYGNAQIGKEISNNNEAVFTEVPAGYFEKGNQVKITFNDPQGEPYYAVYEDSIYQLQPNQSIELLVALKGLNKLYGIVKDFETNEYIEGARVSVFNLETYSDKNGWWELEITEVGKLRKFYTVRASKEGYQNWEKGDTPAQTEREIPILMKPN